MFILSFLSKTRYVYTCNIVCLHEHIYMVLVIYARV
jgi:hypothetical protein